MKNDNDNNMYSDFNKEKNKYHNFNIYSDFAFNICNNKKTYQHYINKMYNFFNSKYLYDILLDNKSFKKLYYLFINSIKCRDLLQNYDKKMCSIENTEETCINEDFFNYNNLELYVVYIIINQIQINIAKISTPIPNSDPTAALSRPLTATGGTKNNIKKKYKSNKKSKSSRHKSKSSRYKSKSSRHKSESSIHKSKSKKKDINNISDNKH